MRKKFPGYFDPTNAEFDDMWERGLIVPDTNILLHLLRYGRETRRQVLDTFRALGPRLWIPNRVAFEFLRQWPAVDAESRAAFSALIVSIRKEGADMEKAFDTMSRHKLVDKAVEAGRITAFVDELCGSVQEAASRYPDREEAQVFVEELYEIIGDEIGSPFSAEQKYSLMKEGEARFEARTPPGYKDNSTKAGEDRFGDFFIWEEMILVANERKLPVIFVSDDRKEDWVVKKDGKDSGGPRPELRQEFGERTGQLFYSYPFQTFLERASAYSTVKVSAAAIEEIQDEEERQRREEQEIEVALAILSSTPSAGTAIGEASSGASSADRNAINYLLEELTDHRDALKRIADTPRGMASYLREVHEQQDAFKRMTELPKGLSTYIQKVSEQQGAIRRITEMPSGMSSYLQKVTEQQDAIRRMVELPSGFAAYLNRIQEQQSAILRATDFLGDRVDSKHVPTPPIQTSGRNEATSSEADEGEPTENEGDTPDGPSDGGGDGPK